MSKSEREHTPLPWTWAGVTHTGTGKHPHDATGRGFYTIGLMDGSSVCSVSGGLAADAAFIVRACNSHYALLEACENVLLAIDAFPHGKPTALGSPKGGIAKMLRAVAAKATGKDGQ